MQKFLTVMIVEDEPIVAYNLELAVEDAGAEVVGPFATTAEALG
jgi:hypothetical protein